MADSLPSPPSSRESTPQETAEKVNADNLSSRLDALLEQYLEVLDRYSKLRDSLSKELASGFLSLAHAQRTSNLGPGRRYGQDGYDERMKALKRVDIIRRDGKDNFKAVPLDTTTQALDFDALSLEYTPRTVSHAHRVESSVVTKDVTEKQSCDISKAVSDGMASAKADQVMAKSKIDPTYRDPVTWFGILVPPALRQVQREFTISVDATIPDLISAIGSLRSLESQIDMTRTELGIQDQYAK